MGKISKLKIAFISQYLPTAFQGGVPRQVHSLANKLIERGYEVTVFSLYDKPCDANYNVKVVRLPFWLNKLVSYKKAWGGIFFPIFVALENFSDFDIIHAHGDSHFIFTPKPIVRTFHGCALEEALRAQSIPTSLYMLFIYPFEFLSGILADRTIAVSKSTTRFFPFIKDIIYNGIDLDKFKVGSYKSEKPSILFVGQLDNRKRGSLLVDIYRRKIKKALPDVELWLVCDKNIAGNGISSFVNINDSELINLYQKAHIFCSLSSYEGFGISYAEAMACGTPVITTANPGAEEVLGRGEYGIMSEKKFIADKIIEFLKHNEKKEYYIKKGLKRAHEFSLEKMVDRYEEIYMALTN